MNPQWLIESDAWSIAHDYIRGGKTGKIAAICVNEVIDVPAAATATTASVDVLEKWLSNWKSRLHPCFGDPSEQHVLNTSSAISALLRYESGPIVRLFGDIATMGSSPCLDFEVIGAETSLVHRSHGGGLGHISCRLSDNFHDVRLIRQCDVGPDLQAIQHEGPPVKLGIISLDHPHCVGNHFPALIHLQHLINVVAIADHDRNRCEPWLATFNASYYKDRDDLLHNADVDAVLITSRNHRHAADVIAAARAGRDIFCDKPIATTAKDTLAIVEACQQNNVRFITTYPCRFHPAMQQLKQALTGGRLGRIEAIMATNHGCMYEPGAPAWVKDPQCNGGGCIIDHTVHVADLIRWLTGQEFANVRVLADSSLLGIEAEDIAVMHGTMTDDTLFQIDASWSRKGSDPSWGDVTMRIVGTKGSASFDLYNNHAVQIYTRQGVELRYPNLLTHQHGMIFLDYQAQKMLGQRGDNANEVDGLRTMELVFAAYESVNTHQSVLIERANIGLAHHGITSDQSSASRVQEHGL